jgi:DUF4097 and DUF4098 domain-containing protein YvlB
MSKRWLCVAAGLILVGIGGAAFYGFNFSKPLPEYRQQWTFDSGDLRDLEISLDYQSVNIDFVPSKDGTNSVRVEGKAKQEVIDRLKNVQVSDGSLIIDLDEKAHWFGLSLGSFNVKQQVTVALTDEAAAALDRLRVSSDAGSVTVNGASARSSELSSDAGSILVTDYEGEQLKLRSDAGTIRADNVKARLEASTDAGGIQVQHLTGTAKLSTDSGSVKLIKDDTSGADIKTDAGSVRVQLPKTFGGIYDLQTDIGSIHAPESKHLTEDVVKVRTDVGSIHIIEE